MSKVFITQEQSDILADSLNIKRMLGEYEIEYETEDGPIIGWGAGKTYEEMYGDEKAIELKEKRSIRMTKTMMGNNPWNKGKKCPSLSIAAKQRKPVSKETRLKMSLSAKGRPSPNKGRKMSEEQKAKLRITGKIARQKQLEAKRLSLVLSQS